MDVDRSTREAVRRQILEMPQDQNLGNAPQRHTSRYQTRPQVYFPAGNAHPPPEPVQLPERTARPPAPQPPSPPPPSPRQTRDGELEKSLGTPPPMPTLPPTASIKPEEFTFGSRGCFGLGSSCSNSNDPPPADSPSRSTSAATPSAPSSEAKSEPPTASPWPPAEALGFGQSLGDFDGVGWEQQHRDGSHYLTLQKGVEVAVLNHKDAMEGWQYGVIQGCREPGWFPESCVPLAQ
ncbi:unnamed protein product, partial [Polarella glacialis]